MISIEQGFAIVLVAVITVIGSIYASRKSAKNERARMNQEMITILGSERQKIADELDEVRQRAKEQDRQMEAGRDELRQVKDEYAGAKIEHREAMAEKISIIREKDTLVRETQARVVEIEAMLNACRAELAQCRSELQNAQVLISQQAQALQESRWQARQGQPRGLYRGDEWPPVNNSEGGQDASARGPQRQSGQPD